MSQARRDQIATLASAYAVNPKHFETMTQAALDKAWLAIIRVLEPA